MSAGPQGVWTIYMGVGGYVCGTPTPGGVCLEPAETEPCRTHWPEHSADAQ